MAADHVPCCCCLLQLEVLEKADCEAMNMGLYLGVAEASDEPPKFIHLTYTPKSEALARAAPPVLAAAAHGVP